MLNRIAGYTIPCPRFAGKIKTRYFHCGSLKPSAITSALPKVMNSAPIRTSQSSLPNRDIITPAIIPPMGVAREGMARRAPAFVAESRSTTWKNSGSMKRYCTVSRQ